MKRPTIHLPAALIAALVLLAAGTACRAQDSPAATDFFHDGTTARAYGMGGAFVGIADDISAIYWNPAGLDQINTTQFFTTRSTRSILDMDITTQTIGAATPFNKGMLGFSLVYSTTGNIPISASDPVTGRLKVVGLDNEDDIAFASSYAWPVRDDLSLGATLKYVRQKVFSFSASGWGLDLGAMYHLSDETRAGITLQNVGGMDIGTDEVPFNVRIGASTKAVDDRLLLSASYDSDFLDEQVYGVGAEYQLADNFVARIGSLDGEFTAGLGIAYQSLSLDYAFNSDDELGDTQKLSIGYRLPLRKPRPRPKEKVVSTPERRPAPEPAAAPAPRQEKKEEKAESESRSSERESGEKKETSRSSRSSSSDKSSRSSESSSRRSASSKDEEKKEPEKKAEPAKEEKAEAETVKPIKKTSSIEGTPPPLAAPESTLPADDEDLPPLPSFLPPLDYQGTGEIDLSFPQPEDYTPVVEDSIPFPTMTPPEAPAYNYDYQPVPSETGENLYGLDPE